MSDVALRSLLPLPFSLGLPSTSLPCNTVSLHTQRETCCSGTPGLHDQRAARAQAAEPAELCLAWCGHGLESQHHSPRHRPSAAAEQWLLPGCTESHVPLGCEGAAKPGGSAGRGLDCSKTHFTERGTRHRLRDSQRRGWESHARFPALHQLCRENTANTQRNSWLRGLEDFH